MKSVKEPPLNMDPKASRKLPLVPLLLLPPRTGNRLPTRPDPLSPSAPVGEGRTAVESWDPTDWKNDRTSPDDGSCLGSISGGGVVVGGSVSRSVSTALAATGAGYVFNTSCSSVEVFNCCLVSKQSRQD